MTETTEFLTDPNTELTVKLLSHQSANNAAAAVHFADEVEELREENEQLREELATYRALHHHLSMVIELSAAITRREG